MNLFSQIERSFTGSKPYAEPAYEYLDRSAKAHAACIRQTLEDWLLRYPDDEKADLVGRFQSPTDAQHRAAAFELYVHELLRRMEYAVTVHPETPSDRATKPDFLAERANGDSFYVEAVTSWEDSQQERSASTRMNIVYDVINQIESSQFFVAVDCERYPEVQPSGRKLREKLSRWLITLDPDRVIAEVKNPDRDSTRLPVLRYEADGWCLTFTAIPRSPEKRSSPARIIGAIAPQLRWLNTSEGVRKSLLAKAKRYGELDKTLIIAINVTSLNLEEPDVMEALFGEEQFRDATDSTVIGRPEQLRKGLWSGADGVRYTRVGGVLFGWDLSPWTFATRDLVLYINPFAAHRTPDHFTRLSTSSVANGRMSHRIGTHAAEILQLPPEYPGRTQLRA